MKPLLEVSSLRAGYGKIDVIHDVSFSIQEGGITAILGANGAGKTTILRAISGLIGRSGSILFAGRRLEDQRSEVIARLGIAHVPDGRGTFEAMTVDENLLLGSYNRRDGPEIKRDRDMVFGYFPRLRERIAQQAGLLSGGEQQMLAIARALMMRPKLLLLDEPSFGLAPLIVKEIFTIMRAVNRQQGLSILLVEQNARLALDLAEQAYLVEMGRVVMEGPSVELRQSDTVRRSYLGQS
jgi:branched-chain amino acid transport system ATP-binding protein